MSRAYVLKAAFLCFIFGARNGWAQDVYIAANAGYSLGAVTQLIGTNENITDRTDAIEGVYGSYGEGFKFGVSGGYMFNDNVGAELGFSYWLGRTMEYTFIMSTGSGVTKCSGSGFVAVPSIMVSTNMKTVTPYARFGVVLGMLKVNQNGRNEDSGHFTEYTDEETGRLAFGFAGALGVVVPAGGMLDFFAETVLYSLSYSPGQVKPTRYTIDGVDQPLNPPEVYEYRDSYKPTEGSKYLLSVRRAFSSIGIVAGVRIKL
jgi:hypothetical protein